MAGMRDDIIHDYEDVDKAIVWDTATQHLPQLKKQIDDLIKKLYS